MGLGLQKNQSEQKNAPVRGVLVKFEETITCDFNGSFSAFSFTKTPQRRGNQNHGGSVSNYGLDKPEVEKKPPL